VDARFAEAGPSRLLGSIWVDLGRRLGMFRLDDSVRPAVLVLDVERTRQVLALGGDRLAHLTVASTALCPTQCREALAALERLRRRDGPEAWHELQSIAEEFEIVSEADRFRAYRRTEFSDLYVNQFIGLLVDIGALEVRPDLDRPAFRIALGTAGTGRWTVLPNFDVLVPFDAPPLDVFDLACGGDSATSAAANARRTPAGSGRGESGRPSAHHASLRERNRVRMPKSMSELRRSGVETRHADCSTLSASVTRRSSRPVNAEIVCVRSNRWRPRPRTQAIRNTSRASFGSSSTRARRRSLSR
jgi:hypothetical protein